MPPNHYATLAGTMQLLGNDAPLAVAATGTSAEVSALKAFGAMIGPHLYSTRERLAARAPRTLPATGASPLRPTDLPASNCMDTAWVPTAAARLRKSARPIPCLPKSIIPIAIRIPGRSWRGRRN